MLHTLTVLNSGTHPSAQVFGTQDHVPFRFTPNLQQFIGPIALEGILTTGILAIARSLTDPEVRSVLLRRDSQLTCISI
jgi:transformation/transcription domain-associated protein